MQRVLGWMPESWLRAVDSARHRSPLLRRALRAVTSRVRERSGTIRQGVGAGLRIDATGSNLGYLLGTSEPEEQRFLAERLSEGDVFYDIGCNIGFFTVLAGRLVGSSGHVYGFEPAPDTAARARRNAEANRFPNVEIVEAAVSDTEGRGRIDGHAFSTMNHVRSTAGAEGGAVRCLTLDSFVNGDSVRPPTLIKIDVEGAEMDVLRGAKQTLTRYRPWVICEVHWLGEAFTEFFAANVAPIGYRLSTIEGVGAPAGIVRYMAVMAPTEVIGKHA